MIRRNVAGQVIYLPQLTTTDGTPVTASATLTVAKDGTEAASDGTLAHVSNGVWKYTPTQAETDAAIVGLILTGTSAVPVVLNLVTTAADTSAVALGANTVAPLDATQTQQAAADAITAAVPANFASLGITSDGHISRVVLVDTCTANTDMRGTDNALLASSYTAPANGDIAAIKAKTDNLPNDPATIAKQDEILGAIGDIDCGGGGGGTAVVNVLPAIGISADRSPGVTLKAFVGETITQSITLYQTNGTTPIVLTGKTLVIVFETRQGLDVATVPNSGITVSGDDDNVVTFNYPAAATSQERVLKFALRDAGSPNTVYLQGLLSVQRAPKVDV